MDKPKIEIIETFDYKGYKCMIKNNSMYNTKLGHIVIPNNDKLYNAKWDEIDINVHGGITFAGELDGEFVIGFDCMHFFDLDMKDNEEDAAKIFECNKTIDYVRQELKNAVEQIIEINNN